ncbi:MAG: POTRA domain-containing protein, partial [Thermoguttaceae bacterium]
RVWLVFLFAMATFYGSVMFGQMAMPAQEQVVEVRIVGNVAVPKSRVIRILRTRAGRAYNLELIEEDVRRLNNTGLFVDIRTFSQQVPGGRVVVFEVIERPTLKEVLYVGNSKIKTPLLEKETKLKAGEALDPFAVEEGRLKIEEFYKSKGFGNVRVTIFEGNKPTDRRVVYLINEGRKQKILWTKFVGNTIAWDDRLRTQIQSKPPILYMFKGEVDRKQIDEDVNRLTAYYRGLGFFSARISRELEFVADQNWLILTFVIAEGPRYKIRNVSFAGNRRFSDEELAARLNLKNGQDFNQAAMNKDVATLKELYGRIGYVFADVKAVPGFDEMPGTLDLVYNVREGDRYRVGPISVEIKGEYPHTKITTVLNRISLKPGDIVDIRKLRESERRLRASGLFLVDPLSGAQPRIVFSPPEFGELETELARDPDGRSSAGGRNIRGQSPDAVPYDTWRWSPSATGQPNAQSGDRYIDLTLRGQWADPPAERAATLRPTQPPTSQFPMPQQVPAQQRGRRIVRGQNGYGRSIPQPQPGSLYSTEQWSSSVSSRQPSTSAYNSPPPSPQTTYPQTGYPQPMGRSPAPSQPSYPLTSPNPPVSSAAQGVGRPPVAPPANMPADPAYENQYPPMGPGEGPGEGLFNPTSPFLTAPGDDVLTRPLPLRVRTEETTTGRLMFGVGVNSDAGLIGNIVIDEQNFDIARIPRSWEEIRNATAFRGAGQRFRIEAIPGTQVQRYMINFSEPYLLQTNIALGLSGYYYNRWYREWDEERVGGRMSLGYRFEALPDLSCSFAYRGAKINISDPIDATLPELVEVMGNNRLHGFRYGLSYDTRDNRFLATEGHQIDVSFEQVLGSFDYARVEVDVSKYFLLHERPDTSGRHVLSLSGRLGYTGSDTPIYEHYYAGGFSTIRGFDFRGASPRDPGTGIQVGGEFQAIAKIQYLFPITADDMLRAVVFCDTGVVQPTIDDWRDKYRVAPGFGLRITMPAMGPAPIALDFAFPLSTERGDRTEVFSFFVGFNR